MNFQMRNGIKMTVEDNEIPEYTSSGINVIITGVIVLIVLVII